MTDEIIKKMTLREKIGQLCVPILQSDKISDDLKIMIEELNIGVLRYCPDAEYDNSSRVVGKPNKYFTPDETADFINSLQKLAMNRRHKNPLLITVDQEGSTRCDIDRAGAMVFSGHMAFGIADDLKLSYDIAKSMAEEFKSMGINTVQSPILDVLKYEGRKTIKSASFGMVPDKVAALASCMHKGYNDGGLISIAKHFPGYGSIATDAHKGTARIEKNIDELEKEDLVPFKRLINEGLEAIMIGHVIVEAIDSSAPATLSEKVVSGLLRKKLGFDGVVMTDAMRMRAIQDNYGTGKATVMAILAGCDLVLLRGDKDHFYEGYNALLSAAENGEISEERINESVKRIFKLKEKANLFENPYADGKKALETVGCEKHRKLLCDLSEKSVSVIRGKNLPIRPDEKILAITVEPQKIASAMDDEQSVDMLPKALSDYCENVTTLITKLNPDDADIEKALQMSKDADIMVFGSCDAILYENQGVLAKKLFETGKTLVVVAMNSPFDIEKIRFVKNYICTYGVSAQWIKTAAKSIFGKRTANAEPFGELKKLLEGEDNNV